MSKKWFNRNTYAPLTELMQLERTGANTFKSTFPAASVGHSTRAYGSHVYAQSAWAAAQVVKKGFSIHSITGYFISLALTTKPFIYTARMIREGGGYCQLQVDASQDESKGICFTCFCSFKRPEPIQNSQQHRCDLHEKYSSVLDSKTPEDHPGCPGVDSPFFWEYERQYGVDPFPGLDMRKVDMSAYNDSRPVVDKRQLQYYRIIGPVPSVTDDPNLHAVAHLYASDRNSLMIIPNFIGVGDNYSAIASLSHTVVFHGESSELAMTDADGGRRWFCQEFEIQRIAHGRAWVTSKIWSVDNGVHVASQSQDGLWRARGDRTAKDVFGPPDPPSGKWKL